MKSPGGKIFLAEQRGIEETGEHRRYSTFNFGDYYDVNRYPFRSLYGLNDTWIAGGKSMRMATESHSWLVLVPITGELICRDSSGRLSNIDVEEVYACRLRPGADIEFINPYRDAPVNFLQFWLSGDRAVDELSFTDRFDLVARPDVLISLLRPAAARLPFRLSIGRFMGRKEATYALSKPLSGVFAFVLSGAFELQGRLLHERDGLALWDTENIELEALSNGAVIIVLEL